jgi:broad specificity phosphatase PhoE
MMMRYDRPMADTRQTVLHLIRDALTADLEAGRMQGQRLNNSLSPRGMVQAKRLAEAVQGTPVSGIYSSDLRRAHETAAFIEHTTGVQCQIDPRLREQDLGEWEGLTLEQIRARFPNEALPPFPVLHPVGRYGGETIETLLKRTREFCRMILAAHSGEQVAIVGHMHSLSALLCVLLDIPVGTSWRFGIEPSSIATVCIRAGIPFLFRLNERYE